MTWNYRVVRRSFDDSYGGSVEQYYIHEAYYNDGESKPHAITKDCIAPIGETPEELGMELLHMLASIKKPVLDYETREELPRSLP